MKHLSVATMTAAALVAFSAVGAAHADGPVPYGRAGGLVGADRIQHIAATANTSSGAPFAAYPGIAGGPVGADRISYIAAHATPSSATQLPTYPGIAGGPVGADRIAWLFRGDQQTTLAASGNPKK